MDPNIQREVIAELSINEGRDTHMYTDSKGFVTTGVGHALFTSQAAVALPFYRSSDRMLAGTDDVTDAWTRLRHGAGSPFRRDLALYLKQPDVDSLLLSDLAGFEPVVHATFPAFDTFPKPVKIALFDMVFNLGSFQKFPKLTAAVKASDWKSAAEECKRQDIGDTRNGMTKARFMEAIHG